VLRDLLQLNDAELAKLVEDGVIERAIRQDDVE